MLVFSKRVSAEILVRALEEGDAVELFKLTDANRSHLRRWLPWLDGTREEADTRQFVASAIKGAQESRSLVCGMWSEGRLCGVVGYNRLDWDNRIAVIGYWLAKDAAGKGIVTRCCRALVDHAFTEHKLNRVVIQVAVGNVRSQAIPDRLGFTREGIAREGEWLYDRYVDLAVNALLRRDWKSGGESGLPGGNS